jgi:hypothetical protein
MRATSAIVRPSATRTTPRAREAGLANLQLREKRLNSTQSVWWVMIFPP